MAKTRVVIADDHPLILRGVKALLEPRYEVVGTAANGLELVAVADRWQPDIIVLDVSMPQLNGFEAIERIKQVAPQAKFVFLSMHAHSLYLRKAIQAGASGYVVKNGVVDELLMAVEQVSEGGRYYSHEIRVDEGRVQQSADELSQRQRQILTLVAEGRLSKEMAHLLGISHKTVDFHRAQLMSRVGARSAAELIRISIERGLLPAGVA